MTGRHKNTDVSFNAPNTRTGRGDEPESEPVRSCLWRFITVGVWIAFVLILIFVGGRFWFLSRFTQSQRKAMDRFETEIVTLPADWQTAAKLPPMPVVEAHIEFTRDMESIYKKLSDIFYNNDSTTTGPTLMQRIQHNDPLTTAEEKMRSDFLAELRPIVKKTTDVVAMPGYTISFPLYMNTNFLEIQSFAKACVVAALDAVRTGDARRAMDLAVLPIRYVRSEPRSGLITHLIATAVISLSDETIYRVANECHDVEALRYGLKLMDEVSDIAHPQRVELWRRSDWITTLAAMKAMGYPADLSPQPLVGYAEQYYHAYSPDFNQWVIDNFPASDLRVKTAKQNLASWTSYVSGVKSFDERLHLFMSNHPDLVEFSIGYRPVTLMESFGMIDMDEVKDRAKLAAAQFDLARLRIAQRIVELENAPIPADGNTSSTLDLSPDAIAATIQTIPDDPFSTTTPTGKLRFSKAKNRFYSIGPDKDDDGMKILYDPSNGTVSDGDVFLRP